MICNPCSCGGDVEVVATWSHFGRLLGKRVLYWQGRCNDCGATGPRCGKPSTAADRFTGGELSDDEYVAVGLFEGLVVATAQDDKHAVAACRDELRDLGWDVRRTEGDAP